MKAMDVHTWSRPEQVLVRHLHLDLDVRFDRKVLEGSVRLDIERTVGDELILDTRDLTIHGVDGAAGWELGEQDRILGAPLKIRLQGDGPVTVRYATSPAASGLQWLDPPQTAGKRHPFLYTQSQAIHARSWIPLQDTPGVRVTFTAEIRVPEGLRAVMGAAMGGGGRFEMPQAVPSYLIALAAGDLGFRELGPRSGVYAEPSVVDATIPPRAPGRRGAEAPGS